MTTSRRLGLILFGLLSVGDLTDLALTDGHHPPYSVAAISAVLGLASLYLLVEVWRGSKPRLLPLLLALRVLSAASATPAFFGSGVPTAAIVSAGAIVVLTVVGVLLVAPARSSKVSGRSSKVSARSSKVAAR